MELNRIIENALGQLLVRWDTDAVQELFGQLSKEHVNEIQPGPMLRCDDEVDPVGDRR